MICMRQTILVGCIHAQGSMTFAAYYQLTGSCPSLADIGKNADNRIRDHHSRLITLHLTHAMQSAWFMGVQQFH